MDELDKIRTNAELVVETMGPLSGLAFDYDAESVEWLDGYINRQRIREDLDEETTDSMISVLGSYLGECICRCYGGAWHHDEEGWKVQFNEKNASFPFNKVRKQFEYGAEDSIYSFFTMIPIVFGSGSPLLNGNESPLAIKPKKRWWKFW